MVYIRMVVEIVNTQEVTVLIRNVSMEKEIKRDGVPLVQCAWNKECVIECRKINPA